MATGVRQWSVSVGVLLVLTGCAGSGGDSPTQEEVSAFAEVMPPTGKAVRFYMYTHCGVEHARIGGLWWKAQQRLSDATGVNAPVGWDNPYQQGRLTVESADRAVFEAQGTEVVLIASSKDEAPPGCR